MDFLNDNGMGPGCHSQRERVWQIYNKLMEVAVDSPVPRTRNEWLDATGILERHRGKYADLYDEGETLLTGHGKKLYNRGMVTLEEALFSTLEELAD